MNKFYVYAHIRNDTGKVFYIGKGKGARANDKDSHNPYWHNIVNKYGYTIEILYNNLTEFDAFTLEIATIARYGRKDLKLGNLVNMTDGGEGKSGQICSKETRLKLSVSGKGKCLGKIVSLETREKLRQKNVGKKLSIEHREKLSLHNSRHFLGKKHTKETRLKMKMSNAGKNREGANNGRSKKVNNGICCFNTLTDAAIFYGLGRNTILRYIKNKKDNWSYCDAI